MKTLAVRGLALCCLLIASVSQAAWNAEWKQRVKLGLNTGADGLTIAAPVDSVPVLVRLHTGNFKFVDARPDGTDLRFVAADDKTPLKFHIEKFDGLNELALIWVQIPKLAPGAKGDSIWLYYGNPNAAAGDDAKGTYDPVQALVYHFNERETNPQDSTANANHAVRSTAKASGSGMIGGGLAFDGNSELALPAAPSLKSGANGYSVSMWFKPGDTSDATLYAQNEGGNPLRLSIRDGKLVAQSGALTAASSAAVQAATWQHVAVVAKDGLTLYVNGQESGKAAGAVLELAGGATVGKGFKGEIDELSVATVARSADWVRTMAQSQGPDQKLVVYSPSEGGSEGDTGPSYLKILLSAVTIDGWVVIGILMVMFVISVFVMVTKAMFVSEASRDNERFKAQFENMLAKIAVDASAEEEGAAAAKYRSSALYRLYASGAHELRGRFQAYLKLGREPLLTDAAINAIRATVDARLVREQQRLNSRMVLLTICIAGGPFLGLLGTVVGVMITFAAIAAAGDVNVNAIAPGIAAALVATVAGLAVAIPALFGYNYLTSRIGELTSDMEVFIDEFVTRIAENHSV
jgi:biopolymer transport protein ExbB